MPENTEISEFLIIRTGAVLVKHVPPNITVMGVAAKVYSGKAIK